jgi:NodT family efflux transporter outer membrane factor (OMF) lipoprotein
MALCAALAGCVVGPDYEHPGMLLPTAWKSSTGAAAEKPPKLARWWSRLQDPLLDALVEEAVQGNLDVAAAKARIREARATYRQSVGALFPLADGSAQVSRNRSASGTTGSSGQIYNQYQAGFDASWEVDLFGANKRAIEAAAYGLDAAEEDLRATHLILIGDIASNYVSVRSYQARIALAKRTAASQRQTALLTQRQLEAGSTSAVDAANATGLAASTEAGIPSLEAGLAEAAHRLSVLTGRPPGALIQRLSAVKPIPLPELPVPTGIPADLLTARPDVRFAERQYAQYTARIGQAEAARYPSVSLTGNLATTALKLGDLGKSSTISWSFGPSLSVPIFHGGQLRAAVEIAEAQRDQYFIAYHAAVLTALEDVENAAVSLGQERRRLAKLQVSTAAYRQAATLSRSLYESGSSSFLEVLDAERALYSAEDSLIQSRADIATDYIALMKALGGGWDGAIDADVPVVIDADTGPHFVRRGGGA